jgi:putative DNA primase/helicase
VFKLMVMGNHKPGLRCVDEAIRRRLHLIPFSVTIPPEERDPSLSAILKREWPGILKWILDGCLEWQRVGLAPPKRVYEATAAYLEAEDTLLAWMTERCERGPDYYQKSSELFASYKQYAEKAGEAAGTQKSFSQALEARGFERQHKSFGSCFTHIRLIPQMTGGD